MRGGPTYGAIRKIGSNAGRVECLGSLMRTKEKQTLPAKSSLFQFFCVHFVGMLM